MYLILELKLVYQNFLEKYSIEHNKLEIFSYILFL